MSGAQNTYTVMRLSGIERAFGGARVLMSGAVAGRPYVAPANSELGGPETLCSTASSAIAVAGPHPRDTAAAAQ